MKVRFSHISLAALAAAAAIAALAASPARAMEFGICAHVGGDEFDIRDKEFRMMRKAGIRRVRCDFTWAAIEPAPGKWNFRRYDRLVADAEARNIRVLPILDYDNPGAYPGHVMDHLDEWCRFVAAVVRRYRRHFDVVEVWNEPNLPFFWKSAPDAEQYAELLRRTCAAVKAVAPEIRVMMGGTAGADADFIEGIYANGGGPCMDIVNIHPYTWPSAPDGFLDSSIRRVRAVMERHGDAGKPLWITEIGWPTHSLRLGGAYTLLAGLAIARPERKAWRVVYAKLSEDGAGEAEAAGLRRALPPGSTVEAWGPARLAAELSTNAVDAVMLHTESFPLDALPALRAFVRDGGVLVSLGGVPMYYALDSAGRRVEGVDCNAVKASLHLGWKAWWTDPGMPREARAFPTDEALAHGYKGDPAGCPVSRFFSDAHLAPGDRMVPLLVAHDGKGAPAVAAAVFLLDSDLKGALVVSSGDEPKGGATEEFQAKYLTRALEIAEAEGVEAFFPYEMQAPEGDPFYSEHHFGLCHRDLSPKPAWEAYKRHIQSHR